MNTKTSRFSTDEIGFVQIAATKILAAVARGEVDLNQLAKQELVARGLDQHGFWVGYEKSRQIHKL